MFKTIYYLFKVGIAWIIGYLGMWAGKWIIASVVLQRNVLNEAAESIAIRAGNTYEKPILSIMYTMNIYWHEIIERPASVMLMKPTIILTVVVLLITFVLMVVSREKKLHRRKNLLLFTCTAMIPFVWFIAIPNHSYVHIFFTFRMFGTFFFSMFAFAMSVFDLQKKEG